MDAVLDSLLRTQGMATATDVVLSGCSAGGWINRDFNFDNIFEALNTLFSVWGTSWAGIWYTTMDAPDLPDEAPVKDGNLLLPFLYFSAFLMWNTYMMLNLFLGMLCDYFARESTSFLAQCE